MAEPGAKRHREAKSRDRMDGRQREVTTSHAQIEHIIRHINQIQQKTCLRWVEKKLLKGVRKSVEFVHTKKDSLDCYTREVGDAKSEIRSIITLGDDCFPRESVIHEMLHALGFLHEHQRIDRDCYVIVKEKYAKSDLDFKIVYDDDVFEKWPYDKRSITHYTRLSYALRDKDEPFGGLFFQYRLGDSFGSWGQIGHRTGLLTCLDVHKIKYRYCGAPDFCDIQPKMCKDTEEEEVKSGCKELYVDIAKNKVKPNPT
ncbi:zinc metalloproteinase nas-14-like [Macrosteles quadrilineatus]|uniref:zinc metalloproteinase nas-14-like n=1 Tax=Macrosteles quadrilineatus TaxID=74068 RepID=UPI0023E1849E|nr:zinc metalloproteinase nas-14-like [Macrosteles quadrilineatus]